MLGVDAEDAVEARTVVLHRDRAGELAKKISLFRDVHTGPSMIILPNAWDAQSARAFERAGFRAIATTIGSFVQAVRAPVNVRAADGMQLAHLASLGVRRVTFASGLARRTFAGVAALATELHAQASAV